jgi:uncharacterized protein YacL (UPF0231 family)
VLTFFVDDDFGVPCARASGDLSTLGQLLESDLQSNLRWIDEVVAALREVRVGARKEYVRDGNSIMLRVTETSASLEHLYGGDVVVFDLDAVEAAALDWREFIESLRPK